MTELKSGAEIVGEHEALSRDEKLPPDLREWHRLKAIEWARILGLPEPKKRHLRIVRED